MATWTKCPCIVYAVVAVPVLGMNLRIPRPRTPCHVRPRWRADGALHICQENAVMPVTVSMVAMSMTKSCSRLSLNLL